jgi:hypothetical protein
MPLNARDRPPGGTAFVPHFQHAIPRRLVLLELLRSLLVNPAVAKILGDKLACVTVSLEALDPPVLIFKEALAA